MHPDLYWYISKEQLNNKFDSLKNKLTAQLTPHEFFLFFFSSRRRHTRWTGDWSSDVCSSDLTEIQRDQDATLSYRFACRVGMCGSCAMVVNGRPRWTCRTRVSEAVTADGKLQLEIGRASYRERV